jgi:hypothetical protein
MGFQPVPWLLSASQGVPASVASRLVPDWLVRSGLVVLEDCYPDPLEAAPILRRLQKPF